MRVKRRLRKKPAKNNNKGIVDMQLYISLSSFNNCDLSLTTVIY